MKQDRKDFLNVLRGQIKSKEAKQFICDELDHHIHVEKQRLIEQGISESEAERKAIAKMGSPIELGQQFHRIHRPKVDWLLCGLLIAVFCLSFLPVFTYTLNATLGNKIVYTVISIVMVVSIMMMDYTKLFKYKWHFYIIGIVILLMLQLIPNDSVLGYPLFTIGPLSISSWFVLPFFYLSLAVWVNNEKISILKSLLFFAVPFVLFYSVAGVPIVFLYTAMTFAMLWWKHKNKLNSLKVLFLSIVALISALLVFLATSTIQRYRMEYLLDTWKDGRWWTDHYLYNMIGDLFSHTGWFGHVGGDNVRIPEAHTDLVFVSITYQYGWMVGIAVVTLLALLLVRMVSVIPKINDSFGRILIIGGLVIFAGQFVYNIAMIVGIVPMVGMSLPFMSYGLIPTLLNAFVLGVVLSVYRRKDLISRSQLD